MQSTLQLNELNRLIIEIDPCHVRRHPKMEVHKIGSHFRFFKTQSRFATQNGWTTVLRKKYRCELLFPDYNVAHSGDSPPFRPV